MPLFKPVPLRRVVVTGMGIVSCIGNSVGEVLDSLKAGKSGITFSEDYAAKGFRSQVFGLPKINLTEMIDRRLLRFRATLRLMFILPCSRLSRMPVLPSRISAMNARARLSGRAALRHATKLKRHGLL